LRVPPDAKVTLIRQSRRMRCEDRVRIRVLLDRGSEPLSGSVRVGAADSREFVGVLELLALIDDIRAGGAECADPRAPER
jgi:hypothetical protein